MKRARLLLVAALIFVSFVCEAAPANSVIVYYFHGNFRCVNCKTIEQNTKEAVEKYFRKELDAGTVVFKVVNVETKGNEHFTDEYKLYTKSVVLSLVKGGKEIKSDNLTKVWEYLRNKDAFHQYIRTEIEKYLKEL
ncbi:MAG: nitrophenyl compound nitroreductase subunit ArsF family protein [Candidatus Omnitrophica bacterium]|nr:nitrophenyl compound nitroreductase subunit ArsF family protein [Candidatus Omnitrophota bacterium]MDD5436283.1 nitrophenyl compound nitroreductase subunit ArsF family protein [Candidatus Omnitrophota bacterium]